MAPKESLSFKACIREPELLRPAKPTPHEFKRLSDIDDQEALRFHIPLIQFYRYDESMHGKDPVQVIKEATAQALVYYYPLAGRLREVEGRKLVVECTGEGVIFIEADADVRLEEFGDELQPPFACLEELLLDTPGSLGIIDSPLMLIQVTRLKCGGFIYASRVNHAMSDATGMINFMKAVGEMARGAVAPSTLPVWDRHLLESRVPPQVTRVHREYEQVNNTNHTFIPPTDLIQRSFFFSPSKILTIRKSLPQHLRSCSTFEVLTAHLWRCRTLAVNPDPKEEVRMIFTVNARAKFNPPLPAGYYGNAIAFPAVVTTAGRLCSNPLGFALELIRKAKAEVTEEYMRSVADLLVLRGRPYLTMVCGYLVSDVTRAGSRDVNFGFGESVYSGVAKGGVGAFGVSSFLIPCRSPTGEEGIVMPICLPPAAMDTFAEALDDILDEKIGEIPQNRPRVLSSL